ncbi:MAG: hypothetical protein H7838_11775 [Magnetococcus sp. DMHC-8]
MLGFIRKLTEKKRPSGNSLERTVRFITKSGITCTGSSRNVGKECLLLVSEHRNPVGVNEEGELIVDYKGITSIFPGTVTRTDKYCLDKYCIAVSFGNQEARDFFDPWIVSDVKCLNCGSADNLEKCPQCKGIQTVCAACLLRDAMCRACRADEYLYSSINKA